MISIITSSYNYGHYIAETIQSVLNQTYTDWELIVVDDFSTDNSVDVIKSFNDSRIKLFINEENIGLSKTIQRGLKEASGDWVVFLESDDLITSDYLEKKIKIAESYPDVNLIFNDCEFFGDERRVIDFTGALMRTRIRLNEKHFPADMFYDLYASNKIFTFSAVMAKRSDLVGLDFNPPMDCLTDWHLWIQMAYIGKFYYINEQLTRWRLHNDSYINTSRYKSPFELQFKTFSMIAFVNRDFKILSKIVILTILWYLRLLKKTLRTLISEKRKKFANK